MKRQDLSVVALTLAPGVAFGAVDEFCKERIDLELQATPETAYYESLHKHYAPVRAVAWLVVVLVAGAGIFAGLNTMYGAVVGRVRELATLQTLGYPRRAIALALVQESLLLAAAASLASGDAGTAARQRRGGALHHGRVHAADRQRSGVRRRRHGLLLGVVGPFRRRCGPCACPLPRD